MLRVVEQAGLTDVGRQREANEGKHLPEGQRRVNEFVHQSKRMERALYQVKGKLYGSTYAIRVPWPTVWVAPRPVRSPPGLR